MRWIGLLVAAACAATATQIPQISFEEVVHQSKQIVAGRVIRSWVAWGPSHEFLWTHYEVQVESMVRGQPATTITISEPGGVLNGRAIDIAGAIHYEPGEHVLLLLDKTPVGYWRTVGWSQGKYRIANDGAVHATTSTAEMVPSSQAWRAGAKNIDGMSLSQARAIITSIIDREAVAR